MWFVAVGGQGIGRQAAWQLVDKVKADRRILGQLVGKAWTDRQFQRKLVDKVKADSRTVDEQGLDRRNQGEWVNRWIHGQLVDKLGRTGEFIGIVMHKTYADRWIHGKVEDKLEWTGGFMDKWWTRLGRTGGIHGLLMGKA
jgi:hypothetical protein